MKTNMAHKTRFSVAFTLVEIVLVVIAIIGVLAVFVFPRRSGPSTEARVIAAKIDITDGIKKALDHYKVDMGTFPTSLQDLLTAPAKNAAHWHGPYINSAVLPVDPWGNAYQYAYPGKHNPASYDLWSTGSDSESGTDDDIGNWQSP
jgi:general secretion pathway protein G